MALDREDAVTSLAAIEQTGERTERAMIYGIASSFLILWGGVTAGGYVVTQIDPQQACWVWPVLQVAGFAVMSAMMLRQRPVPTREQRRFAWRLVAAQIALIGFALLVIAVLGPFSGRQLDAFWPLVFMLAYVLAGIWIGRFLILCGVAIAVPTVVGFWWIGTWYPLWMAAVDGGTLILAGLWLRRQGAVP
jgi:MFS family permease